MSWLPGSLLVVFSVHYLHSFSFLVFLLSKLMPRILKQVVLLYYCSAGRSIPHFYDFPGSLELFRQLFILVLSNLVYRP